MIVVIGPGILNTLFAQRRRRGALSRSNCTVRHPGVRKLYPERAAVVDSELPKLRKRTDHRKSRSNFRLYTTFHSFSNHSHERSYVAHPIEFGLIGLVSG